MDYITEDIDAWITNAATNRARQAKDEIIAANIKHCNANSIALAVGEEAQVTQAYTLGVVKTLADQVKEAEANKK